MGGLLQGLSSPQEKVFWQQRSRDPATDLCLKSLKARGLRTPLTEQKTNGLGVILPQPLQKHYLLLTTKDLSVQEDNVNPLLSRLFDPLMNGVTSLDEKVFRTEGLLAGVLNIRVAADDENFPFAFHAG